MRVMIPKSEYAIRIKKAAKLAAERGLDVLIVNGSEGDYADTRYFSGFWPVFERVGIAISASGDCAMMVGPESKLFAEDVSTINNVFVINEYRESANPSYPELRPDSFSDVLHALGITGRQLRIGLVSWLNTNIVVFEGIKAAYPDATIVRCDDIMVSLRSVKSDNEIACLREAARITKAAIDEVITALKPGVTELQMVGVAQKVLYEMGAEYEGMPLYVFSGKSTRHAISRSSYNVIQKGDIVQLNFAAKVDGYSPSIGIPVSIGKLNDDKRALIEFCLQAHLWTEKQLRAGVLASEIAKEFKALYDKHGYGSNFLYGPCHGLGLVEVESPWMESDSNYLLQPNMTFQIDTFAVGNGFGLRWEKPVVIEENGCSLLSPQIGKIIEVM